MLNILPVKNECSEFLQASNGRPLYKNLPKTSDGFRKVKVRHKNVRLNFEKHFNEFFSDFDDLTTRAVFAKGDVEYNEEMEPFFIFPPNGFKFMYSPNVKSTQEVYEETYAKLTSTMSAATASQIFSDILKFSYVYTDLEGGIASGAEVILYGIPYYYAVRKSLVDDYNNFQF